MFSGTDITGRAQTYSARICRTARLWSTLVSGMCTRHFGLNRCFIGTSLNDNHQAWRTFSLLHPTELSREGQCLILNG